MKPQINNTSRYRYKIKKNSIIILSGFFYTLLVLFFYHFVLVRGRNLSYIRESIKTNIAIPINLFKSLGSKKETLVLDIKHKNILKIEAKRAQAKSINELIANDNDWVKFNGKFGKELFEGKIRLKGDFEDHWGSDKLWSYKLKLNGDKTFLGMKKFAIQHPRTR